MILQTVCLLISVVGASFVLAKASWQIVLLSFACAGTGYALWQIRRAFIRRTKIRALWARSIELEPVLMELDNEIAYDQFINQAPEVKPTPPRQQKLLAQNIKRFPIQKISQSY